MSDAAQMIVELAKRDHAYNQNWHIPGAGTISGREIVRIAQQASGRAKPVITLKKLGLSVLGLVVPVMREIIEMLYLTEEPLVLSGEKYKRQIGPVPATTFDIGIALTIQELKKRA